MKTINIDISMLMKQYPIEFVVSMHKHKFFKDDDRFLPTIHNAKIGDIINHSIFWKLIFRIKLGLVLNLADMLHRRKDFKYIMNASNITTVDAIMFINLVRSLHKDFDDKIRGNMLNIKYYRTTGGTKLTIVRMLKTYDCIISSLSAIELKQHISTYNLVQSIIN